MKKKILEEIHEIGTECIWVNKIGTKKEGVYMGIKGSSGRQASFLPKDEKKMIYVDIAQLYFR